MLLQSLKAMVLVLAAVAADYVSDGAKGGSITITDGTVTAQGGNTPRHWRRWYTTNTVRGGCASGNITITGGTVTATGGKNAPGIGSGSKSNDAASNAGCGEMETITISGGTDHCCEWHRL